MAIYGHPGDPNLGVLGELSVDAAVERASAVAADYNGDGGDPVIPTFQIITTVASSEPGPDGDYSLESSHDHIRPWVDAAAAADFYVILDLQPGYTDFLTQAKLYEEFLVQPHVGLALDPEWRLAPGERHMHDIGQVSADEVNSVASWLADLTRRHSLPQKLLLLHQFSLDMLPDRDKIQTHPELALVVQMDGLGSQPAKLDTWHAVTRGVPTECASVGRTSTTRTHRCARRPTRQPCGRLPCTSPTSERRGRVDHRLSEGRPGAARGARRVTC
ncbi:MAG: hypothetical protein WKF58_00905 [Ilumatobacteraceae bacterium]